MSWKHYVGGIATTIGVIGLAYFIQQATIVRKEKVINSTDIDGIKAQVVKRERIGPWDTYKLEIIDKKGDIRAKLEFGQSKPGVNFYDPNQNLEASLDNNDS